MPQQPHGRNFAANSADRDSQVATSNETVNVLFGGAQRSWMSNLPSVQPTPRPKNPKQSPRKAQQPPPVPLQSAPSVLPSPAPSDEPSPAVSATVDSPNPISASLPGPQSMGEPVSSTATANQLRLPVTEARFAVGASPEALTQAAATAVNQNNRQGSDGYIGQSAECPMSGSSATPFTNTQAPITTFFQPGSAGQPAPSVPARDAQSSTPGSVRQASSQIAKDTGSHTPTVIQQSVVSHQNPPPILPSLEAQPVVTDASSRALYGMRTSGTAASSPSMIIPPPTLSQPQHQNTGPPAKRQRIERESRIKPNPVTAADQMIRKIDNFIKKNGGIEAFNKDAEQPRLQLLRNACRADDLFFVALHQAICLWTRNPAEGYRCFDYDHNVIDAGFYVVEQVLKKNDLIRPPHLSWFADFPLPISSLRNHYPAYLETLRSVGSFLQRAASSYSSLAQASTGRMYPYLVDELVGQLDCRSSTLQSAMFTSSRRRLGVADVPLGLSLDQAHAQDQRNHQDESGAFLPMAPIPDPAELERRNPQLIRYYKQIVAQSNAEWESHRRGSSQLPVSSPTLQQGLTSGSSTPLSLQIHQPSGAGAQTSANSPTVTNSAQSSHHVLTSTPTQMSPNPSPVSQIPNPTSARHFAARQTTTPRNTTPSPGQPPNHMAKQSPATNWRAVNQMASQQAPGQLSSDQQLFLQQQHLRQLQQMQQEKQLQSYAYLQSRQPQQGGTNVAQQNIGYSQHPLPQLNAQGLQRQHTRMNQDIAEGFALLQQQTQQRIANPSQRFLPSQYVQTANAPLLQTQISSPNLQSSQMRAVIPTPGVSPVATQSPAGSHVEQPFAQQPLQGLALVHSNISGGRAMGMVQQQPSGYTAVRVPHPILTERMVLPPGYQIPLCDWPCDPLDRKAIMAALHQSHVRSPKRKVRPPAAGKPGERYYQAVKSLPVMPVLVLPTKRLFKMQFDVTVNLFALRSMSVQQGHGIPLMEHFDGSLRWRVRTCKMPPNRKGRVEMHEWVGMDTAWPDHITMTINRAHIEVRRCAHNGKDQPAELTPYIRPGMNELVVAVAEPKRKSPDQHVLAVELIETRSHSAILEYVRAQGVISEDETLNRIKSRLAASHDDDTVSIVIKDLSIDLADPFMRTIFKTPARGAYCTHMECFDLETWLETRPSKTIKCPHGGAVSCGCNNQPEPSLADKWKCPICDGDARPYSLRIDSFLLNVRSQLEKENKMRTKSILVAPDGTWKPVIEEDDDENILDDDDDGPGTKTARGSKSGSAALPVAPRRPVEVINLLDDDD